VKATGGVGDSGEGDDGAVATVAVVVGTVAVVVVVLGGEVTVVVVVGDDSPGCASLIVSAYNRPAVCCIPLTSVCK
jgi:hypothetical protein